jgi:hypothetical protein
MSQAKLDLTTYVATLGCTSDQVRFMYLRPLTVIWISNFWVGTHRFRDAICKNHCRTTPPWYVIVDVSMRSSAKIFLDFLDRCQPPANATDPPFGLSSWTICTQTDNAIMRDGFRSFFSGHSSCTCIMPLTHMWISVLTRY